MAMLKPASVVFTILFEVSALAATTLLAGIVSAATINGHVVGVHDGDTITVLDARKTQYKIRLIGIDAPESKQPFGSRSKEYLSSLVYRQEVRVEYRKRDRYHRILGKVFTVAPCLVAPCPLARDANLAQIQAGMAWWYRQYARDQSQDDRAKYESAERDARAANRGLWADRSPVPPWEWRHQPSSPEPLRRRCN